MPKQINITYPLIALLFFVLMLFTTSCKRSPTEPPGKPEENITPGRRDYIWSLDTITTDPFVNPYRMWGGASNDLWMVSGNGYVFHYNGTSWKEIKGLYLNTVYGNNTKDIWGASNGREAKLWHYDGVNWTVKDSWSVDDTSWTVFDDLWCVSPTEVYAYGFGEHSHSPGNAFVKYYNGNTWTFLNIPDSSYNIYQLRKWRGKLVMSVWVLNSGISTYKFLEFDGNNFREILSGSDFISIELLGNSLLVDAGRKIYSYSDNLSLFFDLSKTVFVGGIIGRSSKDIFCGEWRSIGHYNGTDYVTIYNFPSISYYALNGICLDSEIVFMATDTKTGISCGLRGKLK